MPTWMGDNMSNNMAVQHWGSRRVWNQPWSGIPPNPPLRHFHGPPQNIQQPPLMMNHSWNNVIAPPPHLPNGYWSPQPNAFQYRPNTRFSVQHLRSRRTNRLSRAHRHNGSRYRYMNSDEDDSEDDDERDNVAPGNRNRRNCRRNDRHDDNNNNNNGQEVSEEEEENCFICGEAMHNCDEARVHMCAGVRSENEDILSEAGSDDSQSMDVCDNKKDKVATDNEPLPSTSACLAEHNLIETMKAALIQEKEQVNELRKDANEVLMKLKEKEKALTKWEKELKDKENRIEAKHEENKIEIKRLEQQLLDECTRMEEQHDSQKGRIKLDIGGHIFTTSTSTLSIDPNSMLAVMFSGRHDIVAQPDGTVFIDRDGTHFRYILNYLRDGPASLDTLPRPRQVLKELRNEAAFYQLPGLVQQIETLLN